MKNLKIFLSLALVFFTLAIFAQDGTVPEEVVPETIVVWLTPFVVLGVTFLIRLAKPLIPAWATMVVVSLLSAAVAWISNYTGAAGETSFLMQTLIGLLSVVINQAYRAFVGGGNAAFARK